MNNNSDKSNKTNKSDKSENKKLIILWAVAIVLLIIIALMFFKGIKGNDDIDKDISVIDTEENVVENETEAATGDAIDLTVTPVPLNDELYSNIDKLNTNLKTYYDENYDSGRLVSVYGFMYDTDTNLPVDTNDVWGGEAPETLKDVNLLYLKPADFETLENIDDLEIDIYEENLKPFTSILTEEGYLVSSADYAGGLVSADDYRSLIMKYNCEHGEIRTPDKETADYKKIAEAVNKDFGGEGTVDIKYMGIDDKYAVVIANIVESPLEFRGYLLSKAGGNWGVRSKELAKKKNLKQFVNEKYPDMDLAMLPYYNLADYSDFKTDLFGYYDQIVSLSELGVEEGDLPAVYCLYSDNFIYYEFGGGKKVLGHVDEGVLTFYKINSTDEAVALMSSFTDKPPVFIIKFSE